MKSVAIKIRSVKTVKEYHTCEDIQKQVWQFSDREIIPVNELITIQRSGGLVLGAFLGNKMVGFAFGFAGIQDGKLIHSSRMLAVLPEYRNYDIGFRLKLAQRAFALRQGIKLVTWTFDPLQSLNAFFNIAKLGITIRRYFVNLYGNSSSVLNKGVPTDRFLAEWKIGGKQAEERLSKSGQACVARANRSPETLVRYFMSGLEEKHLTKRIGDGFLRHKTFTQPEKMKASTAVSGIPFAFKAVSRVLRSKINHVIYNSNDLPVSSQPKLNLASDMIFAEIPYDFNQILHKDNKLAIDWRLKTRKLFTHYFSKGYCVEDVLTPRFPGQASRTSFYILRRQKYKPQIHTGKH